MSDIWFLLLGVAVGGFGTLIGAGGGFLLAPAFIFLFPDMKPAHLTALTLLAVFVNAASGSIIYAKRQTVHWPSVAWFTAAGVPGALLGAWLSHWVPRESYESAFVAFLIAMSAFVFWRSIKAKKNASARYWSGRTKWLGTAASFLIAVLASLLGIGGGVLHVPILAEFFRYPVHLATGTSHAILAISGLAAVVTHAWLGDLANMESFMFYLIPGLVLGAQLGAWFSPRLKGIWIMRLLALALLLVATRILFKH